MNSINGMSMGLSMQRSMPTSKIDTTEAAQQLFSELDSSGKGYLEKSDLQSAFEKVSAVSDDISIDDLYAQLDSDNDGKITEQEFTDSLFEIEQQVSSLIAGIRMSEAMAGMPPPPPPPPKGEQEDAGFTIEELTAQLEEIDDGDSARASLISSIIENFDIADTNEDGRVDREEAMAYDQDTSSETTTANRQNQTEAMGAMPPPPPPPPGGNNDEGFTLEELTAQLEEIGDTDSERASLISSIIENFDAADTDGDGKVSMDEAMAYNQENASESERVASSTSSEDNSVDTVSAKVLLQIMQLMDAYNIGAETDSESSSSISLTA